MNRARAFIMLIRVLLSCVTIVPLLGFSTAFADEKTVLIDFGSSERWSSAPWNNLDQPTKSGLVLTGCRDSKGNLTSLSIRQTNPWAGFNMNGTPDQGLLPGSATSDSFYLESGVDDEAGFQLEGLEPGAEYAFEMFASRMGGNEPRNGLYQVGENEKTFDAAENVQKSLRFEHVKADGEGTVSFRVCCAKGSRYAYLGSLKIEGTIPALEEFLQPADDLSGPPLTTAQAWAVADAKTGEILWELNGSESRPMASTTKIMTAHIVLGLCEKYPERLDDVVTISKRADDVSGTSASVKEGESLTARDLLFGLMLPSGNDAGIALAEHFGRYLPPAAPSSGALGVISVPQDEAWERFIHEMNGRAKAYGMTSTVYLDPHGNSANRSSAEDLVKLAIHAMKSEVFQSYVETRQHEGTITTPDGGKRMVTWRNTNRLLEMEGFHGIKTGTTGAAGECLVSIGERDGDSLIVVVLGSSKDARFIDSRNLYRYAWGERAKKMGK